MNDDYKKWGWIGGGGTPWDQFNPFKRTISTQKRKELRAKRNKKNRGKK